MSLAKYRKVLKGNGECPNPTVPVNSSHETPTKEKTEEEDSGI